ncbi:MAG: hypothetical protein ABI867_43875 [Kofleriaceae bacterium]
MGNRSLIWIAVAACGGGGGASPAKPTAPPVAISARVAADFETAVTANKDAFVALFDFAAVGEYEILLHRYDLNGRLVNLPDEQKKQFASEDGTPYPEARERRNVGNFYTLLAKRTVGTGGCVAGEPRTHYGKLLGAPFEPLPAETPAGYEILRTHANAWLAKGGVVGIKCSGGKGGLAIVYTEKPNARGYDLITIYDD